MRQARLQPSTAPDPSLIRTAAGFTAALNQIKGPRSVRVIEKAAGPPHAGRRVRCGSRIWKLKPLPRGTLSGWFSGTNLPSTAGLVSLLLVCGISAEQVPAWEIALIRARAQPGGTPVDGWDPIALGVHRAIHADPTTPDGAPRPGTSSVEVLTPYVNRRHDRELRAALAEIAERERNGMILLLGRSSTGKTRACVEGLRETALSCWSLRSPKTGEQLLDLLADGLPPGLVVWLNEARSYLEGPVGREVAIALRELLSSTAAPNPVAVIGTMSLDQWDELTRQAQSGERNQPDPYLEVRELLRAWVTQIDVPDNFNTANTGDREKLHFTAARDARLEIALKTGGPKLHVIQVLAGGPLLLNRYRTRLVAPAKAVLTAAMDARRIGYTAPLSAAMLEAAATGYLEPENTMSFAEALAAVVYEDNGVQALIPVRTRVGFGQPDAYRLHDYLVEHALGPRRRDPIPGSVWAAAAAHARDPNDLTRLASQAMNRALIFYGLNFLRASAATGNDQAARRLANLLAARADEGSIAELRAAQPTGTGRQCG